LDWLNPRFRWRTLLCCSVKFIEIPMEFSFCPQRKSSKSPFYSRSKPPFLQHFQPMVLGLCLFGAWSLWRMTPPERSKERSSKSWRCHGWQGSCRTETWDFIGIKWDMVPYTLWTCG
jgi:hypothetical protein